jgi:peptide subunit release factor RF-3
MSKLTLADEALRRRTFAIIAHPDAGKTTLTDLLAFKLGLNDRQGSVDNGSSVSGSCSWSSAFRSTIVNNWSAT